MSEGEKRPPTIGVSIPFFTGALRVLAKQHGEKFCGPQIEQLRARLAEAELLYKEMPDASKPERPKR